MGQMNLRPCISGAYEYNSTQLNTEKKMQAQQSQRCCFALRNILKSPQKGFSWEQAAITYCDEYADNFYWKQGVLEVLQRVKKEGKSELSKKFITQFYQIITGQISLIQEQQQRPLTPNQIKAFKQNLKNSIILNELQLNIQKEYKNQRGRIKTQIDPQFGSTNRNTKLQLEKFKSQLRKMTNTKPIQFQSFNKSRKTNQSKISYRQTVINLADETMSNLLRDQSKQITNLNRLYLQNFIKFTIMLESHIKNPDHQMNLIIQRFIKTLEKQIKKKRQFQDNEIKISKEEMEEFVESIKIFIGLLVEIIYNYYFIELLEKREKEKYNYIITNFQNLFNIVNTVIFKNQKFYNLIFPIISKYNKATEINYQLAFEALNGKSPLYFQVPEEYCLQNQVIYSNQGQIQQSKIKLDSYEKCAQILGQIVRSKTPVGKMKAIVECANMITQTISQNCKQGNKNLILNADQILSVFCYVLSIKKIQNLSSHMFLIEHFASDNQKVSITGYYFSVLSCAVQHFLNEKQMTMEIYQMSGSEMDLYVLNESHDSKDGQKQKIKRSDIQLSKDKSNSDRPISITNSIL